MSRKTFIIGMGVTVLAYAIVWLFLVQHLISKAEADYCAKQNGIIVQSRLYFTIESTCISKSSIIVIPKL